MTEKDLEKIAKELRKEQRANMRKLTVKMKMIKFCPDLTSKEEVVPITIGTGKFTRPVLHKCLQNKCVAYKFGECLKYDNCTEYYLEKDDTKEKENE